MLPIFAPRLAQAAATEKMKSRLALSAPSFLSSSNVNE